MKNLPSQVQALINQPQYDNIADNIVSSSNIRALCATVKNANPAYWSIDAANQIAGAEIAPAAMLSTWTRPERWSPDRQTEFNSLQLHYDLKHLLDYPSAIISSFESVFHAPVKVGDRLRSHQTLRSISDEKTTRLGRGRFWQIEVQYLNQLNELVGEELFNCYGYCKPTPSRDSETSAP
ncbi:FAS1-like dehydratase domain-containing protein [Zhongshania aquimaris]|uniref:MaoC family dehydratase N-terminal domain-containing protein n=1 Tax=Zhongshania aquimaris TaxID=2857107 RepID=A0ABS6VPD3_9GAMM|nr:MaoC family dehydratase N-terminal domain-containing protein [Zhongshania aquimaris]MBW2939914.1 MaoC family dehydratase N-terminal domain-containing protein [Zhongshania aquimaris]